VLKEDYEQLKIGYDMKNKENLQLKKEIARLQEEKSQANNFIKGIMKTHKVDTSDIDRILEKGGNFQIFKNLTLNSVKTLNESLLNYKEQLLISNLVDQIYSIKEMLQKNEEEMNIIKMDRNSYFELQKRYMQCLKDLEIVEMENQKLMKENEELQIKISHFGEEKFTIEEQLPEIREGNSYEKESETAPQSLVMAPSPKYTINIIQTEDQILNSQDVFYIKDTNPKKLSKKEDRKAMIVRKPTIEVKLIEKMQSGAAFDELLQELENRNPNIIKLIKN
jgi:hypothetical protein